jgi:hypothetical protein
MKTLLTAAAFALSLSGAAYAQNMFALMGDSQDENISVIIIQPLTATADGYVAIYDHHRGEIGRLLGVAAIQEGANLETRVQVGRAVQNDVIALLFVGDDFTDTSKAVDSVEIDIDD